MVLKIRPDRPIRPLIGHSSNPVQSIRPERGWTGGPTSKSDKPTSSLRFRQFHFFSVPKQLRFSHLQPSTHPSQHEAIITPLLAPTSVVSLSRRDTNSPFPYGTNWKLPPQLIIVNPHSLAATTLCVRPPRGPNTSNEPPPLWHQLLPDSIGWKLPSRLATINPLSPTATTPYVRPPPTPSPM